MKISRYDFIKSFFCFLIIFLFSGFNLYSSPTISTDTCFFSFRTIRSLKYSKSIIETLLDSDLSDTKISEHIIGHLWTSWDDIIENLDYISNNISTIWDNHPDVIISFFTSLISDLRGMIVSGLAKDIATAYDNIQTIEKLWNIDDKLSKFLIELDAHSGEGVYFLRYLLNSFCKLVPGRVNIQKFKDYYEESLARGRAEISYADNRDWGAARHGVTFTSKIVGVDDIEAEVEDLKRNNFFIGDINIIDEKNPERMNYELRDIKTDDIYKELTNMANILQRPFRLKGGEKLIIARDIWRQQVKDEISFPLDEKLDQPIANFSTGDTNIILENLLNIRKKLHDIILNPSFSKKTRVASLVFDRHLSAQIKDNSMMLVDYFLGEYFPRDNLEESYESVVKSINILLSSLILDRYIPHRIWIHPEDFYFKLDPESKTYNESGLNLSERIYEEVIYLENLINEIVKSMHAKEFEIGALTYPYLEFLKSKFEIFQDSYQNVVDEHPTIFPNINALYAHVADSHIALSPLRQLEAMKDALKKVLRIQYPELFYDSQGSVKMLKRINKSLSYNIIHESPSHEEFNNADINIANEASGNIVLNVLPYDDENNVLVVAKQLEENKVRIFHIITPKENLSLHSAREPIIKASFSNGLSVLEDYVQIFKYTGYSKYQDINLENKIIITRDADPEIVGLLNYGKPAGLICDRGGVTTHLVNVFSGFNIPSIAATNVSAVEVLIDGMPVRMIGREVYPVLYEFRDSDIGIFSDWGIWDKLY